MAETLDLSDPDFTAQMQGLVEQAKQALEDRAAVVRSESRERIEEKESQQRIVQAYQSLPQMLRPFVVGLEAITRATGENTQLLAKLEKSSDEAAEPLRQLRDILGDLQGLVERKDALSKQMFDALHEELRSYKDGFLLESIHRPIIRDLITMYDDLSEIRRQMEVALLAEVEVSSEVILNRLRTIEVNVQNNLDFILEVLARLEVSQLPIGTGKLDKKNQRAVAVESTENPDEDLNVIRTVKRGFIWKDRIVRPEEVVIMKWREAAPVELQTSQ